MLSCVSEQRQRQPIPGCRWSSDVLTLKYSPGGHTNTERGYLPTLAHMLQRELACELESSQEIEICISQQDKHPLQIVRKGD
jgi:hypothetical protein